MTNPELRKHLASRRYCKEIMTWVGDRDSAQMWAECTLPEWLLLYAADLVPLEGLVLAACDCAQTALRYVREGDERPREAIEAARDWATGDRDIHSVKYRARRAGEAADDTLSHSCSPAANAAQAAAEAAYGPDYAAGAASAAAVLAADAARAASGESAAQAANAKMCATIRLRWPVCPEAAK